MQLSRCCASKRRPNSAGSFSRSRRMAEKIKFYTDEHIAKAVAHGLRQRGVNVVTTAEAGMLGATDEQHLAWAKAQGRVFVTHDRDFPRLAAATSDHGGLVFAPR